MHALATVRYLRISESSNGRRRTLLLVLGASGLVVVVVLVALGAPSRAGVAVSTYLPVDADDIVARVPLRDPDEIAARRALVTAPQRLELAVELAGADVRRARDSSDPRFLGRAQATLAPWWHQEHAAPDVLFLRATIRQSLHDFTNARIDLDQLVARAPQNVQAHLARAVVATISADYVAARQSCAAIAGSASALVVATCRAPLDGIAGNAASAYAHLDRLLAAAPPHLAIRGWVLTQLGELAVMRGDLLAAERHLSLALDIDRRDAYARNALADVLLGGGRANEAAALLEGWDMIDSHLLRRAVAEQRSRGPRAAALVTELRARFAAATARGDTTHQREEARFALVFDEEPQRALRLARANWDVQKELADARLVVETAVAARDPGSAAPIRAWARATGVRDAQLDDWFDKLGTAP